MEEPFLQFVLACTVSGIVALAVLLVRQRRAAGELRKRVEALRSGVDRRDAELHHLVTTRLPELRDRLDGRPVTVSAPRHERELSRTAYGRDIEAVLAQVTEMAETSRSRAQKSAKVTLRAMMRSVQSLANEQQLAICTMQDRHDDPDVLEDLLRIDHMNAQLGRRAQAVAVLCGSWPGRQRAASSLTDVVRGATSRIRDYLRVRIEGDLDLAVVSRAVEPVVLTLAELLDNAARHSQPNTTVEVGFRVSHNGVAITIDDAGVAMNSDEIQRATQQLSVLSAADIGKLGDPPQLGFAVAGVLSARYGFLVTIDTRSPLGGTRAIVFLPNSLLTVPEDDDAAANGSLASAPATATPATAAPALAALATAAPAAPERDTTEPAAGSDATGLPRRRRKASGERSPAEVPTKAASEMPATPPDSDAPTEAARLAAGMGAWQRGTRSGRADAAADSEGNTPR